MWKTIKNWFNVRIGGSELVATRLREYKVPADSGVLSTLGLVALLSIILQAITGIVLMFHYVPQSDTAFSSVTNIMQNVPYGWLFRSLHLVGSNILLAVIIVHLLNVFLRGFYSRPREITWISGALALLITLMFSSTGNLLPWNQFSYWSTTVATSIPSVMPVVGDVISRFLKGGEFVSGTTLTRFFALHVALLPLLAILLVSVHVFVVYRIGLARSDNLKRGPIESFKAEDHSDGKPFYPGFLLKALSVFAFCSAIVVFIIAFFPTLLLKEMSLVEANPLLTPEIIRPQWYFLAPYQLIKTIPNEFVGINLQALFVLALVAWPFLDLGAEGKPVTQRPFAAVFFLGALVLWIALTIWGGY